jgi:hypothetical protein
VYGETDTGNPVLVLNPPAPPPAPLLPPAPPPPATTRYSTVDDILPRALTLKVPDEIKICAL